MSSIIIFGASKSKIDDKTLPKPDNFYGDSKLQGEMKLNELTDNSFKVSHIRPPMVYGSNSKGNFPLLVKLAGITSAFPNYENKRSMIYIKNLCNFIVEVIENEIDGELHPQNSEYVKTSDLVQAIGNYNQNTIVLVNGLNSIIKSLSNLNVIQKMFGDLYYSEEMYDGDVLYACYNFEESIADIFE
ncbi:sugar nucleotide-binding protein [Aerococcus viridans]|nr:sugar nucleotide-binding protein [Aerococcus viridans]